MPSAVHAEYQRLLSKALAREGRSAEAPAPVEPRPVVAPPVECVERPATQTRRRATERAAAARLVESTPEAKTGETIRPAPPQLETVTTSSTRTEPVVRWWSPARDVIYSVTDPHAEERIGFCVGADSEATTWAEALESVLGRFKDVAARRA